MANDKLFSRNFTFLVLGQISSLFGNFILRLALSMYILETTGSAAVFAGLLSVAVIPTILLSPFGGILADRANRRNIMVILDSLSGLTVISTILFFNEGNAITVIGVVLIALSILGAFETPTVQACVPQMQTGDNIIKANAIINQIAAVSGMVAPILGSVLYVALGLQTLLPVCAAFFFLTALLECFIKIEYHKPAVKENIINIIRSDFSVSIRFVLKEQKNIFKILLLAACMNFLLAGIGTVGLPYLIRTVLGLSAGYFGAAESLSGAASIAGGLAVGVLVTRMKTKSLYWFVFFIGVLLLPIGFVFLFPGVEIIKYTVIVASILVMNVLATIFSIFIVSIIQQKTPNELLGKIMSYVATVCMCAMPLGQMLFGLLFQNYPGALFWIFTAAGIITAVLGLAVKGIFKQLEDSEISNTSVLGAVGK